MALAAGEADHAASFVRPPGHHSYAGGTHGFCVCNSAAVALLRWLGQLRAQGVRDPRGVVLDVDAHYGDGEDPGRPSAPE